MSSVELIEETHTLQTTIDKLLRDMSEHEPHDPEYATMVTQLDTLYKLKEVDSKRKVDRNTWVATAGNLATVLIIVGYEQKHVITSKAAQIFLKMR